MATISQNLKRFSNLGFTKSLFTTNCGVLQTKPSPLLFSTNAKPNFEELVKKNKVVVFMKGVPDAPKCGFSNAVVQIFKMHGVENYDSHDVLQNDDIRQGIKEFSNWPTIPQVYINGKFVGGCDIMIEMHKNGELIDHLEKVGIESALKDTQNEGEKETK